MSEDEAIFTPTDFIRYVAQNRKVSVEAFRVPERLLLTYQRSTYDHARKLTRGKAVDWWIYGEALPFCVGKFSGVEIGVGRFWIGAPAATMTLEEVIACGANTIVEVGISGGLQPSLRPGDIVIVTKAFRDEGTSHHYLSPEVIVESSPRLRERLVNCLSKQKIRHVCGPAWSTDAVYRETRSKFRTFREQGALIVNMETSAIFALARYRNVEAASAQVISDVLSETGWLQAFEDRSVSENTQDLLKAVLETLSES